LHDFMQEEEGRKRKRETKKVHIVVDDDEEGEKEESFEASSPKRRRSAGNAPNTFRLTVVFKDDRPQETAFVPCPAGTRAELPSWSVLTEYVNNTIGIKEFEVLDANLCQPVSQDQWDCYPFDFAIIQERGARLYIEGEADITPDVGIIDAFNADMEPLVALTEILDNCIEATADPQINNAEVGRIIKITTDGMRNEVVIEDNGTGMAHLKLLHYGKYGLSQHRNESSSEFASQDLLGKFHLTSKFGRYGIGAKSAVFHLAKKLL